MDYKLNMQFSQEAIPPGEKQSLLSESAQLTNQETFNFDIVV